MRKLARAALAQLLADVRIGSLEIVFDDGSSTVLGRGAPRSVIRVSDRAIARTLISSTVGFGDAYVDEDWCLVSGSLLDALRTIVSARAHWRLKRWTRIVGGVYELQRWAAQATQKIAHSSVRGHYDAGNDFFARWLDRDLNYTCGYARHRSDDLETLQRQKNELVLQKLRLSPGCTLMDMGCGWGALALLAAERGAEVTAINVSQPQLTRLARVARERRLDRRVHVVLGDFSSAAGRYDRITAVGLAEHVGLRNLPRLFGSIADRLTPHGVALVHTIGSADVGGCDPWIERRIFPGAYVPTLSELAAASERSGLRMEHVENIGPHYALTLRHWFGRFQRERTAIVTEHGERWARTWELYLALLIPTFELLSTSVFQLTLTPGPGPSPTLHRAVLPADVVGIADSAATAHKRDRSQDQREPQPQL